MQPKSSVCATFGRIYGAFMCISGLANFILPGLYAPTNGPLGGDLFPVNLFMAIAGTLLLVTITLFLAIMSGVTRKEKLYGGCEARKNEANHNGGELTRWIWIAWRDHRSKPRKCLKVDSIKTTVGHPHV